MAEELCKLCDYRPFEQSVRHGVRLCRSCEKFYDRSVQKNRFQIDFFHAQQCQGRGDYSCDLAVKRSSCRKCRIVKFASLKVQADSQLGTVSNSGDIFAEILHEAQREQAESCHSNQNRDSLRDALLRRQMLPNLLKFDVDYFLKTPRIRCKNFESVIAEIQDDEPKFWDLIGWCIRELVVIKLPFIVNLTAEFQVSIVELSHLVDSSYAIMFYAETALPNRQDVVKSFGQLFRRMMNHWPEVFDMMAETRSMIMEIKSLNPAPTKEEFAIFQAMIVCNSSNQQMVSYETQHQLLRLNDRLDNLLHAQVTSQFGRQVGDQRYQTYIGILACAERLRDVRSVALRKLFERRADLARANLRPVVDSVYRYINNQTPYNADDVEVLITELLNKL